MANNGNPSGDPPHFTADHWLLIYLMTMVFLMGVLGLGALVFSPEGDANIVIPMVSLITLALTGLAQKPSFPAPPSNEEAKATAAASVLSTAEAAAKDRAASVGGIVASPTTALVPVPADSLILAGDVVKVTATDESEPGAPVVTGGEVKIEKTTPE